MTSYLYPDGTLIRIKPQGDAFTSTPKYSVEVTKQAGVSGTQDDIAFKVESDGRATPKGPEDVNNPYSEPDNPNQYRATTTRR